MRPEVVSTIEDNAECIEIVDLYVLMDSCTVNWHEYELHGGFTDARNELRR